MGIIILIVIGLGISSFNTSTQSNSEDTVKEFLQSEGYVVSSIRLTPELSEVIMDKKGDLRTQVITGLLVLVKIENSTKYRIRILSISETCSYEIDEETANEFRGGSKEIINAYSKIKQVCY